MNSNIWVYVLGISSTLLGIYILVVSLMNTQTRPDYHIGCYLSNSTTENSLSLRNRVSSLKLQGQENRNFDNRLRNSQLMDPQLREKSIDLTKNVDVYIQKLTLLKKYQDNNMDFFSEFQKARKNYENCTNELNKTFSIQDGKELWNQYKKCFDNLEDKKRELLVLEGKRNGIVSLIDKLLVQNPSGNPSFDLEEELRKIKQKYDALHAQNDELRSKLRTDIKIMQNKNQTKSNQLEQYKREFQTAKSEYDICYKNLKQFSKCEDIEKTLKEYGHIESAETLESRIKSKREVLMRILKLTVQARQNNENNTNLAQMYEKREAELKQLMKLKIYVEHQTRTQCGCSEEQRLALQKKKKDLEGKIYLFQQEIKAISIELYTLEKSRKEKDEYREELIRGYKAQTDQVKSENAVLVPGKLDLEELKENLQSVNDNITEYKKVLNEMEQVCNGHKHKLSLRLLDSETVTSCLMKKDFYQQLKAKANVILRRDDSTSNEYKTRVKKNLNEISYPRNISSNEVFLYQMIESKAKELYLEENFVGQNIVVEQDFIEPVVVQKVVEIKVTQTIEVEGPSQTETNQDTSRIRQTERVQIVEEIHVEQTNAGFLVEKEIDVLIQPEL